MCSVLNTSVKSTEISTQSASLYVGDLTSDVTEALLFEIFNAVGPVASIRVCRDAVTRRSLGYAYVNFHNVSDAERALDTMNFITIRGRPCRIMWSQRDPSLRKSGLGNVFVKNLDKSIDNKTLYDTFSMFGNILSCKVATDVQGISLGYGFVHYTHPEAAEKAIQKVNGMVIAEKKVTVAQFVPREQRKAEAPRFTNVYIQQLPKTWTNDQLRIQMETCGTVDSVFIARDNEGISKGFGFANFPRYEEASLAVKNLNGKKIDGEMLYVSRAMKKIEREKFLKDRYEKIKSDRQKKFGGVNLYVKYLDDTIDDSRLKNEFEKFGTITSAKVMLDLQGRSKGFGFVCFDSQESSIRAMTEMNSKIIEGKPLYVALAQRKEIRRVTLAKERQKDISQRTRVIGSQIISGTDEKTQISYNQKHGEYTVPYTNQEQLRPMILTQHSGQGQWDSNIPSTPIGGQYNSTTSLDYSTDQCTTITKIPTNNIQDQLPTNSTQSSGSNLFLQSGLNSERNNLNQPLTSELLNSVNPSQRKQMIGERIFPLIQAREPKLAGKITGMLLEMDNMELLHLLEDENSLMEKISEALIVLNQHVQNNNSE